jgi:hypothetical protein
VPYSSLFLLPHHPFDHSHVLQTSNMCRTLPSFYHPITFLITKCITNVQLVPYSSLFLLPHHPFDHSNVCKHPLTRCLHAKPILLHFKPHNFLITPRHSNLQPSSFRYLTLKPSQNQRDTYFLKPLPLQNNFVNTFRKAAFFISLNFHTQTKINSCTHNSLHLPITSSYLHAKLHVFCPQAHHFCISRPNLLTQTTELTLQLCHNLKHTCTTKAVFACIVSQYEPKCVCMCVCVGGCVTKQRLHALQVNASHMIKSLHSSATSANVCVGVGVGVYVWVWVWVWVPQKCSCVRWHNIQLGDRVCQVVLIPASGLQGEQPLPQLAQNTKARHENKPVCIIFCISFCSNF